MPDTTPCARCGIGWTEHTFRMGAAADHPFTLPSMTNGEALTAGVIDELPDDQP